MTRSFADAIPDGAVWSPPRLLRNLDELRQDGEVIATARLSSWRWTRRVQGELRGEPWCLEERLRLRGTRYTIRYGDGKPGPAAAVYTFDTGDTFHDEAGTVYQMPGGVMLGGDRFLDESGVEILTHRLNPYNLERTVRLGPAANAQHPVTGLVLLSEWLRMYRRYLS